LLQLTFFVLRFGHRGRSWVSTSDRGNADESVNVS
jgi:hypothetical protein